MGQTSTKSCSIVKSTKPWSDMPAALDHIRGSWLSQWWRDLMISDLRVGRMALKAVIAFSFGGWGGLKFSCSVDANDKEISSTPNRQNLWGQPYPFCCPARHSKVKEKVLTIIVQPRSAGHSPFMQKPAKSGRGSLTRPTRTKYSISL